MASNTFFLKLKETCKKIDSDVNDIKMKMVVTREDHDKEEVASKKICEIQDKINKIKAYIYIYFCQICNFISRMIVIM